MPNRSKFFIIVVQSALIVLLLIYILYSTERKEGAALLENEITEARELIASCINRNDSLSLLLHECRIENAIPPFLDQSQVKDLKKMGLENPVEDLRNDLISNADLISTSAVLGGEMGFYFRDGIHILNKRWVFAYFEDGHLAGALLLRYNIDEENRIIWEVIDEYIYY